MTFPTLNRAALDPSRYSRDSGVIEAADNPNGMVIHGLAGFTEGGLRLQITGTSPNIDMWLGDFAGIQMPMFLPAGYGIQFVPKSAGAPQAGVHAAEIIYEAL